jgi:hypothetical protein
MVRSEAWQSLSIPKGKSKEFNASKFSSDYTNCNVMRFHSLQPFVPSGSEFHKSKQLFQDIGFNVSWDAGDYIGFERDGCRFILQNYNNNAFAENFMISVGVSNAEEFRNYIISKGLPEKYGVKVGTVTLQLYGKEVNIIDIAGVCWHFVEQG